MKCDTPPLFAPGQWTFPCTGCLYLASVVRRSTGAPGRLTLLNKPVDKCYWIRITRGHMPSELQLLWRCDVGFVSISHGPWCGSQLVAGFILLSLWPVCVCSRIPLLDQAGFHPPAISPGRVTSSVHRVVPMPPFRGTQGNPGSVLENFTGDHPSQGMRAASVVALRPLSFRRFALTGWFLRFPPQTTAAWDEYLPVLARFTASPAFLGPLGRSLPWTVPTPCLPSVALLT